MRVLTDAREIMYLWCALRASRYSAALDSIQLSFYMPYQKELRDVLRGMNRTPKISTHESGKCLFNKSELCFILVFPIRTKKIVLSFANIRIIIGILMCSKILSDFVIFKQKTDT